MNNTKQLIINWLDSYCSKWFFCSWEKAPEPLKRKALQALATFLMS